MPARRTVVPLVAVALVLPVVAGPAVSQQTSPDGGFWLNGGLGTGFNEELEFAGSGYVRLGTTLSPHFLLGGQVMSFREDIGAIVNDPDSPSGYRSLDGSLTKTNVTATVLVYPSADGGFFFKAGAGYGRQEVSFDVEDVSVGLSKDFMGTNLGVGWDFRLGDGNVYLTPNIDAHLQWPDLDISATDANILFTLGVGFR